MLNERFGSFIKEKNLFSQNDKLLLAVSGGVDSVVLCDLCDKGGYDFVIAHCNFQLRGKESESDEEFVKSLGKKYNKEVLVKRFETEKFAKENKLSIQEAARELRYEWFEELVHGSRFTVHGKNLESSTVNSELSTVNCILTAHHADDNIETVLMNFFKGTGIAGLRGIQSKNEKIIRPLLFAKKDELIAYAKENKLKWAEDSSNESSKYTRNFFRNEIIPLVEKKFPDVKNNLSDNIDRFAEIEELYHQSITLHKKKLIEQKGEELHIPVLKLKKLSPLRTITYEIIKDFGFSPQQTDEVIALCDSETGKYISSQTHRILKNRNWLIIAPTQSEKPAHILIEQPESFPFSIVNLPAGRQGCQLSIVNISEFKLPSDNSIACLDADKVKFPLLLRNRKTGDYFYPLGMKKKKKLARFLIDEKLSKTEKEKIRVIESNKKIIWIVGHRIDDRFKVTDKTKQVLTIRVTTT